MSSGAEIYVTQAAYAARAENELSFKEKHKLMLLKVCEDGWWLCCTGKGKTGFVPSSYLSTKPISTAKVPESAETGMTYPGKGPAPDVKQKGEAVRLPVSAATAKAAWFLGDAPKAKVKRYAKAVSTSGPVGSFIVRLPDSDPVNYALAVKTTEDGKMQNFLIKCTPSGKFKLGKSSSKTLEGLLEILATQDTKLPVRLRAVSSVVSATPSSSTSTHQPSSSKSVAKHQGEEAQRRADASDEAQHQQWQDEQARLAEVQRRHEEQKQKEEQQQRDAKKREAAKRRAEQVRQQMPQSQLTADEEMRRLSIVSQRFERQQSIKRDKRASTSSDIDADGLNVPIEPTTEAVTDVQQTATAQLSTTPTSTVVAQEAKIIDDARETTQSPSQDGSVPEASDSHLYATREQMRKLVGEGGYLTTAILRTLVRDTGFVTEETLGMTAERDALGHYKVPSDRAQLMADLNFHPGATFLPIEDIQALEVFNVIAQWSLLPLDDLKTVAGAGSCVIERKRVRRIATAIHKMANGEVPKASIRRKKSSKRKKGSQRSNRGSRLRSTNVDEDGLPTVSQGKKVTIPQAGVPLTRSQMEGDVDNQHSMYHQFHDAHPHYHPEEPSDMHRRQPESSTDPMLSLSMATTHEVDTDTVMLRRGTDLTEETSDMPQMQVNRLSQMVVATIRVDDAETADYALSFGAADAPTLVYVHGDIMSQAESDLLRESVSDPSARHFYTIDAVYARKTLSIFYALMQKADRVPFMGLRDLLGVNKTAQQLELPEVAAFAQKRLLAMLSVETCAYLLEMALLLEDEALTAAALKLFQLAPSRVLAEEGALHLSENAMAQLLRSDNLALHESQLFFWITQWGRFKMGYRAEARLCFTEPGIKDLLVSDAGAFADQLLLSSSSSSSSSGSSSVEPMSEEAARAALELVVPSAEREVLRDVVLPLLGRLRMMQFSPWFFANVVRPSNMFSDEDLDVRDGHEGGRSPLPLVSVHLRSRVAGSMFLGSKLLSHSQQRTMNEWFGQPSALWSCVFSSRNDGDSQSAVWRVCQRKRPMFVLVQTTTSHTFGCFTWDSWRSAPEVMLSRDHDHDEEEDEGKDDGSSDQDGSAASLDPPSSLPSFAFLLSSPSQSVPIKFISKPNAGLRRERGACFSFGVRDATAEADVYISDKCCANESSFTTLGEGFNPGDSTPTILSGERNFGVAAMEIFGLASTGESMSSV